MPEFATAEISDLEVSTAGKPIRKKNENCNDDAARNHPNRGGDSELTTPKRLYL